MQAILDERQLATARTALLGPDSDRLIDLVFRLNLGRDVAGTDATTLATARELGWVDGAPRLTPMGLLVADPIREYRFWLDRNRTLHAQDEYDQLRPEHYRGKDVLELGSGFGCNLFSIAAVAGRLVGLEPVAVYRQFTAIFAAREGLKAPEVVAGYGEKVPFPDAQFDIVLCYSSHQYMDVRVAIREMARVLRRGGQVRIIGGTLAGWGSRTWQALRRGQARALVRNLLTVTNTLGYERLGRRLYVPHSLAPTSAPVYPRPRFMDRWLREAGLTPRLDLRRQVGGETTFFADKN